MENRPATLDTAIVYTGTQEAGMEMYRGIDRKMRDEELMEVGQLQSSQSVTTNPVTQLQEVVRLMEATSQTTRKAYDPVSQTGKASCQSSTEAKIQQQQQ